jgi:hypothetical protein
VIICVVPCVLEHVGRLKQKSLTNERSEQPKNIAISPRLAQYYAVIVEWNMYVHRVSVEVVFNDKIKIKFGGLHLHFIIEITQCVI